MAVLDVGQGLATAVMLPGGGSLLYDAGPRWREYDAGERIVVPALRRLGVTHLETLAISHPHPDHDGGVGAVRRELGVGRTWRGREHRLLSAGTQYALGGGVQSLVLNPTGPARNVIESRCERSFTGPSGVLGRHGGGSHRGRRTGVVHRTRRPQPRGCRRTSPFRCRITAVPRPPAGPSPRRCVPRCR